MAETEKTNASFEASLKRLEEITRRLEQTDTPLEESLKLFEEGTALVRTLTGALDDATRRVSILKNALEGSGATEPFDADRA